MKVLAAYEAEKLLSKYVRVPKSILTTDVNKALSFDDHPLVLKIISKQALHKTEIKGVRIVHSRDELIKNFSDLLKIALKEQIALEGILVQRYVEGTQVFIGIKKDETFGHVIGLGLGGIFVEEIKDIQWRKCPITANDAESMIEHLQFKNILKGTRGTHNNTKELVKTLTTLSQLPKKHPTLEEMDVNPLILSNTATIVDARMIFEY